MKAERLADEGVGSAGGWDLRRRGWEEEWGVGKWVWCENL